MSDTLDRFVKAQQYTYSVALREIRAGRKESHWMWFIFPQMRGLGKSSMSYTYGIADLAEAKAYLAHPVLSARLIEITEALLNLDKSNPYAVFGGTDARKLCSSMTLFASVSENGSVFHRALAKFFGGRMDHRTLELLGKVKE
ncbi:MAG: DUF1810 domain-containing protein [Clostridia bacterium]|nr:DUF1810 domain-containing protein [Clostridia bacterium]